MVGLRQACYVDEVEDTRVPFKGIQYDRPVRSRGTFAGFHQPANPQGPAPQVVRIFLISAAPTHFFQCSFSACYDHQVTFEIGNGDGLLTSVWSFDLPRLNSSISQAFIDCMSGADHDMTYGQLLVQMK